MDPGPRIVRAFGLAKRFQTMPESDLRAILAWLSGYAPDAVEMALDDYDRIRHER